MNLSLRVLLLSFLLGMIPAYSQLQPAADAPVFKTRAEVVTVPVVVTDKNGAHLRGLKKEDFEILEDGKPQKIASFDEIQKPLVPPASSTSGQFSNTLAENTRPFNLTILVLDLLNTGFEDQAGARNAVLKYLANPAMQSQPTTILQLSRNGLKVIHDFTTDPKSLSTALQKAPGEKQLVEQANQEAVPAGTPPEIAQAMERLREGEQRMESLERRNAVITTLQAMQQIAHSCAGLPGRKAMLWSGDGFPFSLNEADQVINIGGVKLDSYADVAALYQKTWNVLNDAQVAVYPVDARGLTNPTLADASMGNPRPEYYSHAAWMNQDTISTFQTFAQATGGRAFFNTNDLTGALLKASDDNSEYYLLSYPLENAEKKKPGWHKLSVRVRRDGAQVRARNGFFLLDKNKPRSDSDADVNLALSSPVNYTAVPVTGRWEKTETATQTGKKKAVFLLTMPANFAEVDEKDNNHILLEFAAVALEATGKKVAESVKTIEGHPSAESLARIRTHGLDYRGDLILPPGDYTVRFAVRDRLSGRMGSVSTTLTVTP